MNDFQPPGIIAPHIPADLYRQAERHGRPIVIVQSAVPTARPASAYLVPLAVVFAGVIGVLGTIAAILALFEFAARTAALIAATAGPLGIGGLTLQLARARSK